MDFHLKQWRNQQHESEQKQEQQQQQPPPSAKMPKLLVDPSPLPTPPPLHQPQHEQEQNYQTGCTTASAPLPLFVPEPNSKISNLSAFPDSTTSPPATTRLPRMGGNGYFSIAQWQELELQALIYRYMLAGAAIPPELLQPIKKSLLLHSPPYFLHHPLQHYSYYQPSLLQTGYWGRASMDPEPGRCRRTDGKKWRCSRDVVAGQKYCERHVHRGRNRSRKPVEIPTPNSSSTTSTTTANVNIGISGGGGGGGGAGATGGSAFSCSSTPPIVAPSLAGVTNGTSFSFSGQSPSTDLLHLNNSSSDSKSEIKGLLLGPHNEASNRNDGHILRHFFDDWPRSHQESDSAGRNASSMNSATCLSISMPGNSSSDISLKLSTGNGNGNGEESAVGSRGSEREQSQVNWTGAWGTNQVASMGGPLAEALRSSTSNSSPTSVLHQLPRGSASEISYVST